MLAKLANVGYDPSHFGTHGFRAGGASMAASTGVPDRLFKRHRRWQSENAKDGYVQDSLQPRLQVTDRLGLEREFWNVGIVVLLV